MGLGICVCKAGWRGEACEVPSCGGKLTGEGACANHGVCVAPEQCLCAPGWEGLQCVTPACTPRCLGGECVAPNTCSCPENYGGDHDPPNPEPLTPRTPNP